MNVYRKTTHASKPWTLAAFLLALAGVVTVACASTTPSPSTADAPAPEQPALRVVTTTNIVGDWVENIGGGRIENFILLPTNADPHTFQPGARDITRVAEADLVLSVGITLEGAWFKKLLENAAADPSKTAAIGETIDPIEFVNIDSGDDGDDEIDKEDRGGFDPHFWFDPLRVKRAVTETASRLSTLDPEGAELYSVNARTYNAELDELHGWIVTQVEQIPSERRLLVTSHASFGYLAERYGFEIVGTVIPGVTTTREPSAQELAELVKKIRERNVTVIFSETTVSDRLTQRVAEETGAKVVTGLRTGSLGDAGSGADTYTSFMRTNVAIIVEALK